MAVDFAREQRHAFVSDCGAIERMHFESQEVGGFEQLRENHTSIEGAVGRVVASSSRVGLELDKPCIFDPVAFGGA
jgi:hypothetical protein